MEDSSLYSGVARRFRPDVPEISPVVFEELLVNALMHRDYLISAPIRLFIFDNRIEIISPATSQTT